MYTFSYYLPREVVTIAPRPWWKPWAKPQIVYKTQYERQHYTLTEAEAELLITSDSAVVALVRKLIPGATMWQLEQGKPTSQYVRTTS